MRTATVERNATAARSLQSRVDQLLRFGRSGRLSDRRAEREVAYGDYLKVLLEDIRSSGRGDS